MTNTASVKPRRIAALWFPYLATDRLCAKRLRKAPLVVAAKDGGALRLHAVNVEAELLGLRRGMALADARAMVTDLSVVQADIQADLGLLERIAAWCDRYTPFVALDPPQTLLLDVTGCAHLFRGEHAMLVELCEALERQGLHVRGAVAGISVAARALAREKNGAIAASGEEASVLSSLPVDTLPLEPFVTHAFRRAGLKTIGQVAGRSRAELVARFGEEVATLLDCALGKAEKPISPRVPLPDYMAEHRFADPIVSADAIAGTLRTLAQSMSRLLEERGQGARAFEGIFFRADGMVYRLGIETSRPTCNPKIVESLFRERLDALVDPLDPGFGFDLIRLSVPRAERLVPETMGFEASGKNEDEIAFLVDRLAVRFGASRILSFRPNDTHIPEAAGPAVPAQTSSSDKLSWQSLRNAGDAPRRPLRLFARPEPIEAIAEIPEGPPLRFRWRRALHEVVLAEGPERIAMEWWRHREAQPTRDYFRVEDGAGRRFWLYRAGLYGRETQNPEWFVHGLFA